MQKTSWKEIKRFILILFVILLFVMQIDIFTQTISVLIGILTPLLIGIVIGFLLNRIMVLYEKGLDKVLTKVPSNVRRILAIVFSYISFIIILIIIVNIIVPEIVLSVERLASNFGGYIENLEETFNNVLPMFGLGNNMEEIGEFLGIDLTNLNQLFSNIIDFLTQQFSKIIPSIFSITTNIISNVITFFISIFISVYLLMDKEKIFVIIKRMVLLYTNEHFYEKAEYVGHLVVDTFNKYVVGQLLEACILGTLCFIGMKIFGFDYALLISVLVGITALVPILGAYLGGGISFFLLLMISPLRAVLFLVYLVVLQQIENNFIYPYVVGGSLGLPPLLVLLSITVGGSLFGLIGMILAVPVSSVIYTLIKNDLDYREAKRTKELENKEQ